MKSAPTNACTPREQAHVVQLYKETLRQVKINHDSGTKYITIDLSNQANAEASATRDYRGRYLFELLQNANDAITAAKDKDVPPEHTASPCRVRIEITDSSLIVANDGLPFGKEDVDSIYQWGKTSKDPNKSIGYKGIGFKSVLEITDSPQIFSQCVQFRFDRKFCQRAVQKIIGTKKELKLPTTRFVFPYRIR